MPSESVKYNTLLIQLKTKVSGFIKNTLVEDTFIMVSPKSLYPDKRIIERNISNKDLPPWIYINIFYKVTLSGEKPTLK